MEIRIMASGLGHREASYEMFGTTYNVPLKESEYLILCKLSELNNKIDAMLAEQRGDGK